MAQTQKIDLSGSLTSHTGGIMFGVQWALGKHVSLDWWLLGAAYGVSSGVINGIPTPAISQEDIPTVKRELEEMDIPMVENGFNRSLGRNSFRNYYWNKILK